MSYVGDTIETVTTSDWIKGISLSIAASVVGGASKLAIRKSWLLQQQQHATAEQEHSASSATSALLSHDRHNDTSQRVHTLLPNEPPIIREDSNEESTALSAEKSGSETTSDNISLVEARHEESGELLYDSGEPEEIIISLFDAEARRSCAAAYLPICLRGAGMFGMMVLNPICCVLAMNYASPSILAPFSGLTLVWIILFSEFLIGEKPARMQVIACSLIVLGEVVVAVFGDHTNDEDVSAEDVRRSYKQLPILIFFGVSAVWFLLMAYWIRYACSPTIRRFAWGVSGGSLAGFQNFIKDFLTVAKSAHQNGTNSAAVWGLLIFLLSMAIFCALGGLLLLVACMKRYDATYSAAMYVGSFVITASIMSWFHYTTFERLDNIQDLVLYPTGVVILMIGVCMLVLESKDSPTTVDEDIAGRTPTDSGITRRTSMIPESTSEEERLC